MFRAVAGIWPFGAGEIATPPGSTALLLPQRPYIPQGTLRAAVTYPAETGAFDDAAIRSALEAVRLSHLVDQLDVDDPWSQRLSGGEQQRLAIARALLARPDWLFLDEATAALDEPLEAEVYGVLRGRLPDTTVVSIGHRSTLIDLHDEVIAMEPGADGVHVPRRRVPNSGPSPAKSGASAKSAPRTKAPAQEKVLAKSRSASTKPKKPQRA
jgi:vitamin B12/bleomycin/antimicrobial peptide transport system ATP-binding/permease protein